MTESKISLLELVTIEKTNSPLKLHGTQNIFYKKFHPEPTEYECITYVYKLEKKNTSKIRRDIVDHYKKILIEKRLNIPSKTNISFLLENILKNDNR